MLFFVRFEVTQPASLSNADLIATWKREADAALEAIGAGVATLYKVAGQRTVLAILDVPSPEELDRALGGLPIVREMGGGVTTEALPIYPYETFAADLKSGVHGG